MTSLVETKPVILGISPLVSFILALKAVAVAKLAFLSKISLISAL